MDSLLNFENVKLYCNEAHEVARYDEALAGYEQAAIKTQTSLSALNFGQNAIFSVGLAGMMYMCTQSIAAVSTPLLSALPLCTYTYICTIYARPSLRSHPCP
jgi:ABC-type transport system involved in Fe-S cluster assembly fused permease/ATPase subunit